MKAALSRMKSAINATTNPEILESSHTAKFSSETLTISGAPGSAFFEQTEYPSLLPVIYFYARCVETLQFYFVPLCLSS